MTQDLAGYTPAYYQRDAPEFWFAPRGLPRPDQLAAICYLYGVPFWGSEPYVPRHPGAIVSIGAGEGWLEHQLEMMGQVVIGVDPAAGARELYRGYSLIERATRREIAAASSVLFCESIEHIPIDQVLQIRSWMQPGSRLVVVNWPDFHPIEATSAWDHITRIDDELYDRLSVGARVVLRRGSHLVLDIEVGSGQ